MICDSAPETPKPSGLTELNRSCSCLPLDRSTIDSEIIRRNNVSGLDTMLAERPNLFAGTAVFISKHDISQMQDQINAIEVLTQLPAFQKVTCARLDRSLAEVQTKTRGVFMGYDFHITADGPRLIEVNTNAGGAFLVSAMDASVQGNPVLSGNAFAQKVADMIKSEWRLSGRDYPLRTLAIIDNDPASQYLYPEFLMAKALLSHTGFDVLISAPEDMVYDGSQLRIGGKHIDMVYNRLTDFHLAQSGHSELLAAYLDDKIVLSPAPRHHALYADKRNLTIISDTSRLEAFGLPQHHIRALSTVPKTLTVTASIADELWKSRRKYFFKPASGFGSRAAYRGDKLTHRAWATILGGDYVAQAFVAPAVRQVTHKGITSALKYDVRVYTYSGEPFLMAARVYQGQTTNFRTPGGGFALVIPVAN